MIFWVYFEQDVMKSGQEAAFKELADTMAKAKEMAEKEEEEEAKLAASTSSTVSLNLCLWISGTKFAKSKQNISRLLDPAVCCWLLPTKAILIPYVVFLKWLNLSNISIIGILLNLLEKNNSE